MVNKWKVLSAALMVMGVGTAQADDAPSMFKFSGFGTLGVVHSSESNADFTGLFGLPNGAGHTSAWSTGPDSRLAVQVNAQFTSSLSGLVQVMSEHRYDNSYDPDIEMATLKYSFTSDFQIRAGRLPVPLYLVSENRKIGYTNPWVRPPSEVYDTNLSYFDGADASYRFHTGELAVTATAFYGNGESTIASDPNTESDLKNFGGVHLIGEYGASTFRLAYMSGKSTTHNAKGEGLFNIYRSGGFTELVDRYQINNSGISYTAVGYAYDPGTWFFQTELTRSNGQNGNSIPRKTQGYVSGGYRFGSLMPYVTFAKQVDDSPLSIGTADPIGYINSMLAANNTAQHTVSAGFRWDVMKNIALKAQIDHVQLDTGSHGNLTNQQMGRFVPGGSYNLFSASVDFVF